MDTNLLRVLLGAVFVAMGGYYGFLAITAKAVPALVSQLLNVLMCAAMVAMLSPWGSAIHAIAGIEVFTAAALWFCYLALFAPHACAAPGFHAMKMLAMVWMAVAMALWMPAGTAGGHDMAAMSAPAITQAGVPGWSVAITAVVALVLLAGAIQTSTRVGDFARAAPAQQLHVLADGSLAIGMAMAFFAL